MAVTGRERESHPATQTRDPPRAHTTPPHHDPCKPTKNPQQTHCKQQPWRSRRERESVLTSPRDFRCHHRRIASPLSLPLSSHRLASVVTASSRVSRVKGGVRERDTKKMRGLKEEEKIKKSIIIILNSKIKYRGLKEKTTKYCFVKRGFEYKFYSDCIRVQKQNTSTKQTKLLWVPLFFGFEYRKLDLNPATKHALMYIILTCTKQ